MRKTFNPRGKGGNVVREIADMLAKNGHRGIHVEWAPPRKQARHDDYRLWRDRNGVWRLTLNISGEPRIIARLGVLSPHVEVEVRRKLDELFGTGIEKEGMVMAQQDPSGPAGEVAMPELPVNERPLDLESALTSASHPTGDSFNREWLVMILESLLEGKEEVKILQLYRVIMEKAEVLGLGGSCDHSKIHRALVALQRRKDATLEVNRQGVSSTWTIRRKTSEAVQAADPPTVGVPSMTEESVFAAIIKMADGVPPSVDGWIDIPHIKGRIIGELYGGRHAGYGKLAGIFDALQRTGRLNVRRDEKHPDVWCVRFPEAVKESTSSSAPAAPEVLTVPILTTSASHDSLAMALAGHISPVEFCDNLRGLSMARATEVITRLVNMQAQIRRLLDAVANDEVFAMMRALVTRISAEKGE